AGWQPCRAPCLEQTHGCWTHVPWAWAYRMPVFIAYMALVLTTSFWPTPKNLAHVLALTTALLIGIQFWYANQGGVYVLWYLPLLLLLVFRPNLADKQPSLSTSDTSRPSRFAHRLGRFVHWVLQLPEPAAPVS